jgi:hypothetical protein
MTGSWKSSWSIEGGLCAVAGFGISGSESSGSATGEFVG